MPSRPVLSSGGHALPPSSTLTAPVLSSSGRIWAAAAAAAAAATAARAEAEVAQRQCRGRGSPFRSSFRDDRQS